jgi:hypothetical protein
MAWPGQTMVAAVVGFNGATSSQTWNRRRWMALPGETRSFNGATSSQTWNRPCAKSNQSM